MKSLIVFIFLLTTCFHYSRAQKVDNTASYRKSPSTKSFRVHYENDFFSRSDIYYTQGINLEYYNPSFSKVFKNLLLHLDNAQTNSGIAVEHLGFTPTSITSPTLLIGDRPFAACLMSKIFSVSRDSVRKIQFAATLSAGIIGPAAGGKQFQATIHRWINDRQPMGWNNQVSNDLILNYNASLARGVINLSWLSVALKGSADLGTLTTKAGAGLVVMAGLLATPWSFETRDKLQVYAYTEPLGSLIGYDATLQGGLLNDKSPYTISPRDITRTVFQANNGIIFVFGKIELEYFQSLITKEFRSGKSHHWGGVRIGIRK